MMSFTPTTYSTASNAPCSAAGSPSSSPGATARVIFNACGFGVVAWGDRARGATADLVGDSGPPVEPSCITSSASASAPDGLSSFASRCASSVLAAGASSGAGSGVEGSASSRSASSSCSCWRRRRVPQLGQRSAWRIGTKACCFARSRVPRQRTASRSQFPRGLVGTEARDRSTEPNNQSPCNHTVGTICVLSFVLFRAHLHSSASDSEAVY